MWIGHETDFATITAAWVAKNKGMDEQGVNSGAWARWGQMMATGDCRDAQCPAAHWLDDIPFPLIITPLDDTSHPYFSKWPTN